MDQLIELLAGLSMKPDKVGVLQQIKITLSSLPKHELEENVMKVSTIGALIDCLNSNSNEVELALEIIKQLLQVCPADYVLSKFEQILIDGLHAPNSLVKLLVLQQILRAVTTPEAFLKFLSSHDALRKIIYLHIDESLSVVQCAQQIVIKMVTYDEGLNLLFAPSMLECFHDVMNENDTIKYRIIEVVVAICKQSEQVLKKCVQADLLVKLILDVENSDVLVQLNALGMLSELAMVDYGLSFLENIGILRKLETKLDDANSDFLARFLLPGLFKFFGHACHLYPQRICTNYRNFISMVYQSIDSSDTSSVLREVALQTVGIIGVTTNGKNALNSIGNPTIELMKALGRTIQNSTMELKVTTLNTIENLFTIKDEDRTADNENLLKRWFDNLADNPMKLLMDIIKHPFSEVRCATLGVYKALTNQSWSQRYMNDYPGFIEYLLDRSTESEKVGKDCKFEVIRNLANSPIVNQQFNNVVILRMRQYVNEGPYFVEVESAISFEEES